MRFILWLKCEIVVKRKEIDRRINLFSILQLCVGLHVHTTIYLDHLT